MNGVSVIICCYNSSSRIITTLRHLQKQELSTSLDWEVIIVDNASTDATAETARETWSRDPITKLRVVPEEKPGLMHARNKGLENALSDIVSFVDDDNWVEERWVQKVADIFAMDKKIGACGGRSEAVFEKAKPEWFPYFENSFAAGTQADEGGYIENTKGFLWGAGLSFRKSLWTELKRRGYKNLTVGRQGKNITAGEDTELCYAFRLLGYKLYYQPDLLLFHFMPDNRMKFSYLEKMCVGFGKSFALLNCYRVLLYPHTFRLHSWYFEWMATRKRITVLKMQLLSAREKPKRWQIKTEIAYWKGYASQVWQDKAETQKNISMLKSVFNS